MILPSPDGGVTTDTVGYFEFGTGAFAEWLASGFGPDWVVGPGGVEGLGDVLELLRPGDHRKRLLCVPVGEWTALLTDGVLGTDVGLIPSRAAKFLGCRAIRATNTGDEVLYPARILAVYGPDGEPPLMGVRSITAANDGGRWVFETYGEPYPFEDLPAYERRIKASRFTQDMLYDYLRALEVPIDEEPGWARALLVSRSAS